MEQPANFVFEVCARRVSRTDSTKTGPRAPLRHDFAKEDRMHAQPVYRQRWTATPKYELTHTLGSCIHKRALPHAAPKSKDRPKASAERGKVVRTPRVKTARSAARAWTCYFPHTSANGLGVRAPARFGLYHYSQIGASTSLLPQNLVARNSPGRTLEKSDVNK